MSEPSLKHRMFIIHPRLNRPILFRDRMKEHGTELSHDSLICEFDYIPLNDLVMYAESVDSSGTHWYGLSYIPTGVHQVCSVLYFGRSPLDFDDLMLLIRNYMNKRYKKGT